MRQITSNAEKLTKKNVINRISDIPGGVSLVLSTLVAGNIIMEATPLSAPTDGKRSVCKQSKILTGSTVDDIIVDTQDNQFKLGDIIGTNVGGLASAIDEVTDNGDGTTTLGVASSIDTPVVGDFIYEMAEAATALDASLNIAYDNDTCTGLTGDATSTGITSGGKQGTSATIVGDVTGDGNAEVTVSSDLFDDEVLSVALLTGDVPSVSAAKMRQALLLNAVVTEYFDVVGNDAEVTLVAKEVINGAALENEADVILKEAFEVPSVDQVIWMADALVRADVVEACIGSEYLADLPLIAEIKY